MSKTIAHVPCTCKNEFQDKQHRGRRVANLMNKSVKSGTNQVDVKCTVCSKIHTINNSQLV